jgi:hypothetical protein
MIIIDADNLQSIIDSRQLMSQVASLFIIQIRQGFFCYGYIKKQCDVPVNVITLSVAVRNEYSQ